MSRDRSRDDYVSRYGEEWALEFLGWCVEAWHSAVYKCNRFGVSFEIKLIPHLSDMAARAGGHCEVSGMRFSDERLPGTHKRPLMPSIDRIERNIPYTPDNCRLVCTQVNIAINEWGLEQFLRITRATVAKHGPGKS